MSDYPENVVPFAAPGTATNPRQATNLTAEEALRLVARVARHRGALAVEVTIADGAGRELPHGVEWSVDPVLRVQAIAVFPDSHTVIGQTAAIDRFDFLEHPNKFPQWQIIACAELLEQFLPLHPTEVRESGRG